MKRKTWEDKEIEIVRILYPNTPTANLAMQMGRSMRGIYQLAQRLGISKSKEFLSSAASGRVSHYSEVGRSTRFKKGQIPANKGLRRVGWSPGRMRETQFRQGQKPQTWRPIGTTRISKDGYLQRKSTDTGNTQRDWLGEHILLWEQANGPVPAAHVVTFRDGNKANIVLENLQLLTRAELMARNTVHRLPKELAEVIQLAGALQRKIRSLDEKQNVGSA